MKTPHRIMYEALTPEEWKRFIKNDVKEPSKLADQLQSHVILYAFPWHKDGNDGMEFWGRVHDRLCAQGQ